MKAYRGNANATIATDLHWCKRRRLPHKSGRSLRLQENQIEFVALLIAHAG
jgi:hypothetical protein